MGNLMVIITTNQGIFQNITIVTITIESTLVTGIVTDIPTVDQVMGIMETDIFMDIGRHHQNHLLNFTFDGTWTEGLA